MEALNKEELVDLPQPNIFTVFNDGRENLESFSRPIWREHRRIILRAFRTVGVGKPEVESLICQEIDYLVSEMEKINGEPLPLRRFLSPSGIRRTHSQMSPRTV